MNQKTAHQLVRLFWFRGIPRIVSCMAQVQSGLFGSAWTKYVQMDTVFFLSIFGSNLSLVCVGVDTFVLLWPACGGDAYPSSHLSPKPSHCNK